MLTVKRQIIKHIHFHIITLSFSPFSRSPSMDRFTMLAQWSGSTTTTWWELFWGSWQLLWPGPCWPLLLWNICESKKKVSLFLWTLVWPVDATAAKYGLEIVFQLEHLGQMYMSTSFLWGWWLRRSCEMSFSLHVRGRFNPQSSTLWSKCCRAVSCWRLPKRWLSS